jgi:cytochrome c oxidase subunit 4
MTDTNSIPHDDHQPHTGVGIYIFVFVGLCILTTMSFLTYFDFWREHVPVHVSRVFMMAVSCTKAMLVIMFFMHLKWEANWKWVLTVPASVMSALLILALVPDIGLRMRHYSYERLIYAAEEPATPPTEKSAAENQHQAADSQGPEH